MIVITATTIAISLGIIGQFPQILLMHRTKDSSAQAVSAWMVPAISQFLLALVSIFSVHAIVLGAFNLVVMSTRLFGVGMIYWYRRHGNRTVLAKDDLVNMETQEFAMISSTVSDAQTERLRIGRSATIR